MRPEIVVDSSDLDLLLGFLDARTPVAGQWECAIGFFESTGQIGNTLVFLCRNARRQEQFFLDSTQISGSQTSGLTTQWI